MPMKKKNKKVIYKYKEDTGETIYSMAALHGRTPEEQEEYEKKLENRIEVTGKERGAMIKAAFSVYVPLILMVVGSFALAALLMYVFLK